MATIASGFEVSERTVREWLGRYDKDGAARLENRSSRPTSMASRAGRPWRASIERMQREYRLTGKEQVEKLSMARSTVDGGLTGLGISRVAAPEPKTPVYRYQDKRPRELL